MSGSTSLRWVVASQFVGALADNALLLVAMASLAQRQAAAWTAPALRIAFYLAFVLLSAHASALADAWPKKAVVTAVNVVKLCGCALLLAGASPLAAYALVGIGAAAHAPARYGLLTELSADGGLVTANAWMEASTVLAMMLGTVWGSFLVHGAPVVPQGGSSIVTHASAILAGAYVAAVLCSLAVRGRPASNRTALRDTAVGRRFRQCLRLLWRDPAARVSLAVTSLFWAVAAVLQFAVLRWGIERLGLTLSGAGLLQAAVGVGMIAGAAVAGRWVREDRAMAVLPAGAALAVLLALASATRSVPWATVLLFAGGVLAGVLVVPMNTVLQRRGLALMNAGEAIGAQNYSENLASLVGLAVYGAALAAWSM